MPIQYYHTNPPNLEEVGTQWSSHNHFSTWMNVGASPPPHSSHPSLPHLALLVFEAVLEVVCVSLPGYIVAQQGMFTADMQKFTANLNVTLFTPCLIFTKLASQLTPKKLIELAIIPLIFLVQTLVSLSCSYGVSKAFGFTTRQRNFVIAMGVFGNSNSLPISLVLSLSQTIKGLHWDKVVNDNDDEVAARGILYLLIFQQLGQLVRWTWGFNVLLAPYDDVENEPVEGELSGSEIQVDESQPLLGASRDSQSDEYYGSTTDDTRVNTGSSGLGSNADLGASVSSAQQQPPTYLPNPSAKSLTSNWNSPEISRKDSDRLVVPNGGTTPPASDSAISSQGRELQEVPGTFVGAAKAKWARFCSVTLEVLKARVAVIKRVGKAGFQTLPESVQHLIVSAGKFLYKFGNGLWEFMNPPLWAMLAAIVVASIPELQKFFFNEGSFFTNSVTSAIRQSGGVAVPLILVVLGGNLARNTLPSEATNGSDKGREGSLLIASLISRMLLPTIVIAPLLALMAKYIPVSILEDPIFVIVCFLITGAPTALQLAQICQINGVYVKTMSKILFQSYVVWILPSTLLLVMCALEVVEWAQR